MSCNLWILSGFVLSTYFSNAIRHIIELTLPYSTQSNPSGTILCGVSLIRPYAVCSSLKFYRAPKYTYFDILPYKFGYVRHPLRFFVAHSDHVESPG